MTTSHKLNFRSCQPKDFLTNRTVNLFQDRAYLFFYFLIATSNTISASADAIRLSADILIVFSNAIRVFTTTYIAAAHALQEKVGKKLQKLQPSFIW